MQNTPSSALQCPSSLENWDMPHFPLKQIRIGRENERLYDQCGAANHDDITLYNSIRKHGVQEPLVLTRDHYLVSGHRRRWAAMRAGLETVPVRIIDKHYEQLSAKERLLLLRDFNQQRTKSNDEKFREVLVDTNPLIAHSTLLITREKNRRERALRSTDFGGAIELGGARKRAKITTMGFLKQVQKIVSENEEYWPLTDRRIHYLLLNDPPLKHDKKLDSRYCNDTKSYKALTNLLTRARLERLIPMEAIDDPTRPITLNEGFDNCTEFIAAEIEWFLTNYRRNLLQDQPAHIEILLEKAALRTIVERVALEYCVPVTTTRGYASLCPRVELASRFRRSGKRELVLLILADFDPDGEEIAASLARSLRDDFSVPQHALRAIKVGLTFQDVLDNDFPSNLEAKDGSAHYSKFVQKYGDRVVELDAAPVEWIQEKLRGALEAHLDMAKFNAQAFAEQEDAVTIDVKRRIILETLSP